MMGQTPDADKDGQIVQLTEDGWIPFGTSLSEVKVLDLTKCYK